jgi:hypothetical protein
VLDGSASHALSEYVELLKASLKPNAPLPKAWRVGKPASAAAAASRAPVAAPLFGSTLGGGARAAREDDVADMMRAE